MQEEETLGAMFRRSIPRKQLTTNEKINTPKAFNNSRSVYDQMLQVARQNGNQAPTPGYLRLEKSINTTIGQIQFDLLTNAGQPNVTERRLKLADSFTALQWGLFISRVPMAGAAPTTQEMAKQTKYTYPESKVFSGAGEASNLMNIYNGYTSLRIGSDIIIDSFPNYKFYRVPDSQQGMQYAATAAGVTIQSGGWPNPDWGFLTVVPSFTLMGSQTIELNVNLPQSINMAAGAGYYNNLVFEMYGFLTQNGANFNSARKR